MVSEGPRTLRRDGGVRGTPEVRRDLAPSPAAWHVLRLRCGGRWLTVACAGTPRAGSGPGRLRAAGSDSVWLCWARGHALGLRKGWGCNEQQRTALALRYRTANHTVAILQTARKLSVRKFFCWGCLMPFLIPDMADPGECAPNSGL